MTVSDYLYKTSVSEESVWITGEFIIKKDGVTAVILDIEGYF